MAKKVKMSAKLFGLWIEEHTSCTTDAPADRDIMLQAGAKCRLGSGRTDCVININNIEPGKFAALYAVDSSTVLLVVELADSFASEDQAWQAIDDANSPAHPPRLYAEWLGEQYLTDKTAQVERLEI